uniref:Phage protein n=1 Tax=Caenorhabditis tropicalis TaxID=1561998 RepID=A0A1I7U5Z3_9PELO
MRFQYTRDVVVTGFDTPFEDYDENPSAAVVDELMKEKIENVKIHPHKIPATYEGVVETLPSLRENFPDEVLHLAAHSIKNTIYFEDRAFSDGYCFEDSKGFIPKKIDIENEDEKLKTIR